MIADHPIVGCGPGNFQNAYTQYKLPEATEEVADPHNFLLEIWATAGTPAAVAFLAILACFGWEVRSRQSQPPFTPVLSGRQPKLGWESGPVWILIGGLCGFLLAVPVGILSAAPPGLASLFLGFPLAVGAMVLMWGWTQNGRLPRWLAVVGAMALLVDLLAAGGIGYPSVASTFWLLAALGLQGDRPREHRPVVAWAVLAVSIALAVVCYRSAYNPVLGCQAQLRSAEREPAGAIERLQAAAAADPWASEPWRQLAAIEFQRWWQEPTREDFKRFTRAQDNALELAPNSAAAWLAMGDWTFRAFSKTGPDGKRFLPDAIESAMNLYRRAVQLYPNSALYRVKLAEAYRTAGDQPDFRREAEAALRLDDLTPQSEKKLPGDLRNHLATELEKSR
jgi:hypothetical protein